MHSNEDPAQTKIRFSSVQSLSSVQLSVTPWTVQSLRRVTVVVRKEASAGALPRNEKNPLQTEKAPPPKSEGAFACFTQKTVSGVYRAISMRAVERAELACTEIR